MKEELQNYEETVGSVRHAENQKIMRGQTKLIYIGFGILICLNALMLSGHIH